MKALDKYIDGKNNTNDMNYNSLCNPYDLEELKELKQKDKKFNELFKETFIRILFACVTLTLAYQMVDNQSFYYQSNLKNLFGAGDKNTKFLDVNQ